MSTPWPGDPPGIACDRPGHSLCSAEVTFSSIIQTRLETPGKQRLCLVHGSSREHTLNRCALEERMDGPVNEWIRQADHVLTGQE